VLGPPSKADTELKPQRAAPVGGVGEPVRHLSPEDLEAYVSGRVPPPQLNDCRAHLDSCLACRAELEDLRTRKSAVSGFPHPEPLGRELERRRRRRTLTLVRTTTVAIIFAAVASTAVWWGHGRLLAKKPRAVAEVRAVPPGPAVPAVPAVPAGAAGTAGAAGAAGAQTSSPPLATASRPAAAPAAAAREPALTSAGAPQANEGFVLLGPFGEEIAEPRPEFHWTPLAGAVRYSVAIVDERLHPVQHSRALRTTSWRPRRPLRRGRTYLWQVTATLRGGSTVVASGPSSSGALLRISPK
jgi:hypothetical protein